MSTKGGESTTLPRHISQRNTLVPWRLLQTTGVWSLLEKNSVTILKTSYNTVENKVNCDWALGDLTVTDMSAMLLSTKAYRRLPGIRIWT